MKNVLVVISSFRWGGINVALQGWLANINPEETKVDVFVMVHSGTYDESFQNCNILPKKYFLDALIDHASLKHGLTKLVSGCMKVINRLTKEKFQHRVFKKVGNSLVKGKEYDAVIGWHEGVPTTFVSHVKHPNKIAWIHCDYANYTNTPYERDIYNKLQTIVCVSNYTRGTFLEFYPELAERTKVIYNILDVENIKVKALQETTSDFVTDRFTIVSVGRVSPVKRFSKIPEIARKLLDVGCEFVWYIVGPTYPGEEHDALMANLAAYNVSDRVVLLGGKDNPYPYIAKADLLVSTSLSEALPFVVNEAKVLGVPVVTTNYGSSYELIEDGFNGFIRPIEELAEPIAELIGNKELYCQVKSQLKSFVYDNDSILEQIDSLL